jgi:hypothetical protein
MMARIQSTIGIFITKSLVLLLISLCCCRTTVWAAEKTVTGKVRSVNAAKTSLTVEDLVLEVARKTKITVDGVKATLADIKLGQQAMVSYDDDLEVAISIVVGIDAEGNETKFTEKSPLQSGRATIATERLPTGQQTLVIKYRDGTRESQLSLSHPMFIEIVDDGSNVKWIDGGYSTIQSAANRLSCVGEIITDAGTHFIFDDTYSSHNDTGSFKLNRTVRIEDPSQHDIAFASRFSLPRADDFQGSGFQCFAPGIWYFNNMNLPPTALASDSSDEVFLFREDRLPLPVVMLREKMSGISTSIAHSIPDGATFSSENGLERIVDERMQFGSLGIYANRTPSLAFVFPGTEGAMTYVHGANSQKRSSLRSHPVKVGVRHKYELVISISRTQSYGEAVKDAWRTSFRDSDHPLFNVNLTTVYANGVAVLEKYASEYDGVPGIPFSVRVPDGGIKDVSFQVGFVGQQTAAGHHLIKYGLENNRRSFALKGEAIVDWWVKHSLTKDGLPRTWFDVNPNRWRDYKTFTRIASDGAVGVLRAWSVMERHGNSKPQWLDYCESYGKWLVAKQNSDGSFYRQYNFVSRPVQLTKFNTTHPVTFLVELNAATKDEKYLKAAVRAGEFSLENIHPTFRYVGGTPDNPDVIDKEAGLIALDAFLALYDATGEKKWLDGAIQAATYSETWLYCWNVPMPEGDAGNFFPKGRSTVGMSIISTGHSGADTFMAYYPFQYYRLYLLTGDSHFLDVAKLLLYDTKQLLDVDGSLHYAHAGLQTEAMTVALPRGHGVKLWLPWLTVAAIDPLTQLQEAFGSMRIEEIEQLPLAKRLALNEAYGQTRGFPNKSKQPLPSDTVFLDDIKENDSSVGHGTLGKRGSHGYGSDEIAVNGTKAVHSLSLHPKRQGSAHVKYELGKKYAKFSAEVAISDAAPKPSESPLTFRVIGDGKELWKSKPIRSKGVSETCSVGIQGIKELTLIVDCPNGNAWAFAVWINPLVSTKGN